MTKSSSQWMTLINSCSTLWPVHSEKHMEFQTVNSARFGMGEIISSMMPQTRRRTEVAKKNQVQNCSSDQSLSDRLSYSTTPTTYVTAVSFVHFCVGCLDAIVFDRVTSFIVVGSYFSKLWWLMMTLMACLCLDWKWWWGLLWLFCLFICSFLCFFVCFVRTYGFYYSYYFFSSKWRRGIGNGRPMLIRTRRSSCIEMVGTRRHYYDDDFNRNQ